MCCLSSGQNVLFEFWPKFFRSKMSVSDNTGRVKVFFSVLLRALVRARYFALVEHCHTNQGSLQSTAGLELGPTHASLRSACAIMIASSNFPDQREAGCPIDMPVFYFTPSLIPGWQIGRAHV